MCANFYTFTNVQAVYKTCPCIYASIYALYITTNRLHTIYRCLI